MPQLGAYFSSGVSISQKKADDIKSAVTQLSGVTSVSVNDQRNTISVDFDGTGADPNQILNTISRHHEGFIQQGVEDPYIY